MKRGDTVAIVGAGPIGLAALLTSRVHAPAEVILIDPDERRLQVATSLGATKAVNSSGGHAAEMVLDLTGGAGVDVAIESLGVPASFDLCQSILAP